MHIEYGILYGNQYEENQLLNTFGPKKMANILQTLLNVFFYLGKKAFILISVSLKFVHEGLVDNTNHLFR